jgi:hypothetical protein
LSGRLDQHERAGFGEKDIPLAGRQVLLESHYQLVIERYELLHGC